MEEKDCNKVNLQINNKLVYYLIDKNMRPYKADLVNEIINNSVSNDKYRFLELLFDINDRLNSYINSNRYAVSMELFGYNVVGNINCKLEEYVGVLNSLKVIGPLCDNLSNGINVGLEVFEPKEV
jgi:hypothetical protein